MSEGFRIADAFFSPDRVYRYSLVRGWDDMDKTVLFVMLNPSTADENVLDPTVTRCYRYARQWGYNRLLVANLFALRATDPRELLNVRDPIGPENPETIKNLGYEADLVVAAWGAHRLALDREPVVLRTLEERCQKTVHALGVTLGGSPRHPLYLRRDLEPRPLRDLIREGAKA